MTSRFGNQQIRLAVFFEEQVEHHADRTATKLHEQTITYNELNCTANLLAHTLLNRIREGNEPVALLLEQGIEIIMTIIPVLNLGKFFVALNPTHLKTRLSFTLQDLEVLFIVTDEQNHAFALDLAGEKLK